MIKKLLIGILLFVTGSAHAQVPDWQWAINGGGSQYNEGHDIAIDNDENVYTTGRFSGVCDFDAGPGTFNLTSNGEEDIFILKVDSSGNFIWARSMGSAGIDDGKNIALDAAGNVIVSGLYRDIVDFDPGPGVFNLTSNGLTELFILKLDSAGNFIWAKSIGNSGYDNFVWHAIDFYGNNDIYLTGAFGGVVDFDPGVGVSNLTSAGDNDIYLLKLDSNGQFIWVKQIGSTDNQTSFDIALNLTDSVNIFIAGSFFGTVDFDPSSSIYNLTAVGLNSNSFVLKLDSAGNFSWVKGFISSGNANSVAKKIELDTANNSCIYVTGNFSGTVDFNPDNTSSFFMTGQGGIADIFVVKLNDTGNFNWAFSLGSSSFEEANSIKADFFGGITLIGNYQNTLDFDPGPGTYNLTSSGGPDIFIAGYDSSGTFLWVKTGINPNSDGGYGIAISPYGNLFATGNFYNANLVLGTISLPFTLTSGSNYFLGKLSGMGIPTSISNTASEKETITIFPNPAINELKIKNSELIIDKVVIMDMFGRRQTSNFNPQNNSIDISSLAAGIYTLNIISERIISSQKFIINR